jgi:magnesium transporter
MLTILKNGDNGIEKITDLQDNCWIRAVNPTEDEIKMLTDKLAIPRDYIDSSLDRHELPHLEHDGDTILIILREPHFQGKGIEIPFVTVPVGLVFTPTNIVTISKTKSKIVDDVLDECDSELHPANKFRFILLLLLALSKEYLKAVEAINEQVDKVEKRLTVSQRNLEVLQLLNYQKSLVYFTTALRSTDLMMERLEKGELFEITPEDKDLHEDVLVELRQAKDMTQISGDILSQMMDAFASIISNNLNVVMKMLAIITIVITLPNLVAGFMGMNVALPLENHPNAFWIIMFFSAILGLIAAFYFWRKHWF